MPFCHFKTKIQPNSLVRLIDDNLVLDIWFCHCYRFVVQGDLSELRTVYHFPAGLGTGIFGRWLVACVRVEGVWLWAGGRLPVRGSGALVASADGGRLGGTPRPTMGSDRSIAAKMAALHTAAQERGPPVRSRNGRDAQFRTRMNGRTGRSTGWGEMPIS